MNVCTLQGGFIGAGFEEGMQPSFVIENALTLM